MRLFKKRMQFIPPYLKKFNYFVLSKRNFLFHLVAERLDKINGCFLDNLELKRENVKYNEINLF